MMILGALFIPALAHAEEDAYQRVMNTKTLRCGYFAWPPWVQKDPNTNKISGLNYDVVEAIGKNLGIKIEWAAEIGLGEVVQSLNSGKSDMICSSLWPDPARAFHLTLTLPIAFSAATAYARADDHRFDGDLSKANSKDIKVSVIDGDLTQHLAEEKFPEAQRIALPQTASGSEMIMQVTTKKADIATIENSIVNDFAKTNPGKIRKVSNVAPIRIYGEHFALKQGEYQLRDMINVAIEQLTNDGVIDELNKKYAKKYDTSIGSPLRIKMAE